MFETNSSSTHSISISKEKVSPFNIPKFIQFNLDDFGWEYGEANKADYLYTAAAQLYDKNRLEEFKNYVLTSLLDIGVDCSFAEPTYKEYTVDCNGNKDVYLDNGHIDHVDGLTDFLSAIADDNSMLLRYLFGDSHIYTGNDNEPYDDTNHTNFVAREYVWDYDNSCMTLNKYHDSDNYDYFYKGN